jgi:2-polyprenyl-6-methoxyphenol hydroxylase-like FAD-dependent oxidoreductase
MRQVPALIVGGGPAGSAAAIGLARGGVAAELIERTAGPQDVVCGGFLGWDALAALRRLGIDPAELGACPIFRLRLVGGERVAEAALPRPAAGLSRRTLDAALLQQAIAAGVEVRRGRTAKACRRPGRSGSTRARRSRRSPVPRHRQTRAARAPAPAHSPRGRCRRPAHQLRAEPAHPRRAGELHRAPPLRRRLCRPAPAGGWPRQSLPLGCRRSPAQLRRCAGIAARFSREAPRFGERLAEAGDEPWLSISNVPYGWRVRDTEAGLFRLGDQAAVIASLAGDGIAIALTSGLAAADAHLAGASAGRYQQDFAGRAARPLAGGAGTALGRRAPSPTASACGHGRGRSRRGGLGGSAHADRAEAGAQRPVSAAGASVRH